MLQGRMYLRRLEVEEPQLHLILGADGRLNLPHPRVPGPHRSALQTIMDLAVRHFDLRGGRFEVEGRGRTAFAAKGEHLRTKVAYDPKGARYQGSVGAEPVAVQWGERALIPAAVKLLFAVERNRIHVPAASVASGKSSVELSGEFGSLTAGQGVFQYKAQTDLGQVGQILHESALETGDVRAAGQVRIAGWASIAADGTLEATQMGVRLKDFRLAGGRVGSSFVADLDRIEWRDIHLTGTAVTSINRLVNRFPVAGRVKGAVLREGVLSCSGITAEALNGLFTGRAEFPNLRRARLEGIIRGFDAQRLLSLVSRQAAPWDGSVAGALRIDASLADSRDASVDARMTISPALSGPAVSGTVAVHYDARPDTLDFGHSVVSLPHTQVNFSGILGRQLQLHVESRNLGDLTPGLDLVLSNPPKDLPIELRNGKADFDGTIHGPLAGPSVEGRVTLANFSAWGNTFDSFRATVAITPSAATVSDAALTRQSAQLQASGAIALAEWRPVSSSAVSASVSVKNAPIADILAAAGAQKIEVSGALGLTGRVWGTYGDPRAEAQLNLVKGLLYGEPYDSVTAVINYAGETAQVSHARLTAGSKQITAEVSYRHAPGNLGNGRARFEAASNQMALEQFQTITKQRPGLGGTIRFRASGEVEAPAGAPIFRIRELNGEVSARGLRLEDQQFGDVRLAAESKGATLSGTMDWNFAGAAIHGSGQGQLSGDNSGSGEITFRDVDILRVQQALGFTQGQFRAAGSLEGTLVLSGPVLQPELWKGVLRITRLQVGPAPHAELVVGQRDLTLANAGPIMAALDRRVVKVESARLVGRATDLSLAGTVSLGQRSPLDLKLTGRIDLTALHDYDTDIISSGTVRTEATIRGPFERPLVNGRLEVKDAAVNVTGLPNALANGNGVILFNGNAATIQSLTWETGGGKITLTGFAGYATREAVFRLQANASQVRVRYPEGVSTVADAKLTWTGTTTSNMVTGSVTVLHSGFNPRTDLSAMLALSTQPVRTPSARTGFLAGTHFDVAIETSPSLTVESSLTQDVLMEGNLRLRGTFSNPALLGRVNIVQGELIFFGTKYRIDQGSISFFNPVRVEPVVSLDLQTKARGIDVILNISGPLGKLALTPRSDPPLPFNEIVSLLATGRAPTATNVPALGAQSVTASRTWQQMGASALLTEAVANPVAGRLQRFFGITRLRIDPSMTGVEFNPQARLTLEQSITPNITFTYMTNITQSNPLVVQIEWALNPRWSLVAVRDENAMFGIDFFFKKRFR
jgi:translocation and assembly module TamB